MLLKLYDFDSVINDVEVILFLEEHWKNLKSVLAASSFNLFFVFVPGINSALRSPRKQFGSKCSEHTKSVARMFCFFKLSDRSFLKSSFFGIRWKVRFFLSDERLVQPGHFQYFWSINTDEFSIAFLQSLFYLTDFYPMFSSFFFIFLKRRVSFWLQWRHKISNHKLFQKSKWVVLHMFF